MGKIPDKVRKLIYERDGGRCVHCGETEAIGLHHRVNRGMGGSKLLDIPSNLITLCNVHNAALESDPVAARQGRYYGWKLGRWDDPAAEVFYDTNDGLWYTIDNLYARRRAI
jgi:hypothetical protein